MFLSWFTHPWFKTRMCIKELYLYSCHLPQVNPCYYPPTVFLFFFFNQQQIIQKFGKKGAIRMKFSAGVYLGVQIHTCIPRHSIKDVKVDLTYHWLAIICQQSLFKGCEASLLHFFTFFIRNKKGCEAMKQRRKLKH